MLQFPSANIQCILEYTETTQIDNMLCTVTEISKMQPQSICYHSDHKLAAVSAAEQTAQRLNPFQCTSKL